MNAQNNNNLTNINVKAIIERLQTINLDVAKVEEVCEYGGNCWSTPSADITNLIHELEEVITPVNPVDLKIYVLEITPSEKWINKVHRTLADTVPGHAIRELIKDYIHEASNSGFLVGSIDWKFIMSWWPIFRGYYDPEKTIRVKVVLPPAVVKQLNNPIIRASFIPRTCTIEFAEGNDPSVMNRGNAAPSRESDYAYAWKVISDIFREDKIDLLMQVEGPDCFDGFLKLPHDVIMRVEQLIFEWKLALSDSPRCQGIQKELKDLLAPYTEQINPQVLLEIID